VVTEARDGVWTVLQLSRVNSSLLPSDVSLSNKFYEVTVDAGNDATVDAGFNNSLDLQPIILPTAATGSSGNV